LLRKLLSRRPSPALVIALVALVSSFAGPAIADEVARMAQSVTGNDIRNNSVTGRDVRNNSLTGGDIRDNSLGGREIRNGGISSEDIGAREIQSNDLGPNAVNGGNVAENSIGGTDLLANTLGPREINVGSLDVEPAIRHQKRFFLRMAAGQRVELVTHRNIRLVANCVNNADVGGTAGQDAVRILTEVLAGGAYQATNGPPADTYDGPEKLGFNASDDVKELFVWQAGDGEESFSTEIDAANVLGPDNEALTLGGGEGIVAGVNVNGAECVIGGLLTLVS
jgi:hypothetical protein